MVRVVIDSQEYEIEEGLTIIQACESVGITIPRFCYHKRLDIAGNCRMCLVQVEKAPKPVASCVQQVTEGMVVHTKNEAVQKMRKGVMEMLLANHPLDCPICDQGGECDLQDQAMAYGLGSSRFTEEKRSVQDKNLGPLIKTHMTRCIHCTRCVRFIEDVAGTCELGATGRGENMEVGTYIEKAVSSELSGNIIDLCPVGALTSKPYAFKARPWELKRTPSIDVMDGVGSNIIVCSRGMEVMRILPAINDEVNEEWISDKARFSYDGLKYQRIDKPMVRTPDGFKVTSWDEALEIIKKKVSEISPDKIGAIAGRAQDVESMFAMKLLLNGLGSQNHDVREVDSTLGGSDSQGRYEYLFNSTIAGIEEADHCLIVGSNPRTEAPIVNARIRKAVVDHGMEVALVGFESNLNYPYRDLGNNKWILKQIYEGNHPYCATMKKSKKLLIIVGDRALHGGSGQAVAYYCKGIAQKYNGVREGWNGYSILHHRASTVGGLDIGFVPGRNGKSTGEMIAGGVKTLILMGEDDIDMKSIPSSTFIIYMGHHGDRGAYRANLVLPTASYTEKTATYVNTEGRVQQSCLAVAPPGEAVEDWKAIQRIAQSLGVSMQYRNINGLRKHLCTAHPMFNHIGSILTQDEKFENKVVASFVDDEFHPIIDNFYMTDPISRHSKIMAQCSKEFL